MNVIKTNTYKVVADWMTTLFIFFKGLRQSANPFKENILLTAAHTGSRQTHGEGAYGSSLFPAVCVSVSDFLPYLGVE